MKRLFPRSLFSIAAAVTGCSSPSEVATLASISVTPASQTVASGAVIAFQASAVDSRGAVLGDRVFVWSSSDTMLVSINSAGVATAKANTVGSAQTVSITATSEGKSGSTTLRVSPNELESVTVSPPTATVDVTATQQLTATLRDADGNVLSGRPVIWSSSNEASVMVSNAGLVTAIAVDTATITVTSGEKLGTASISVRAVQEVSASSHTMILKTDGTLWATGRNESGQLGDGTTISRSTPRQVQTGVRAVSAGLFHTMILKTDGTLWATGGNSYGQLGDGTTSDRRTWVQVMAEVQAVAAGYVFTMILKNDGTLWAAGFNLYGQLGDGTTSTAASPTPKQVMTGVRAVAASGGHTMILKTDRTLWVAGWNASGQLGDGTTVDRATPVEVMTDVEAVAAGREHSMIIKADGTLWAAGYNNYGQLGDGTVTNRMTPVQVMTSVRAVAPSDLSTMILRMDGTLWAMGINYAGQFGDGTTSTSASPTPRQVTTGVRAVATGSGYTMMIKTDGTLWAAGGNNDGQLGDGTTTRRISFQQVIP
jgi:alpha-tubulin suppressor-like RCC1 family protein